MIAHEFEYSPATQLTEALALLADGAKPLAGGMSLIPMMKLAPGDAGACRRYPPTEGTESREGQS